MKIAFVCPHFYPHIGGVETVVMQLALNLVALGHQVTILTQTNNTKLKRVEKLHNITIRRFKQIGLGKLNLSLGLLHYLLKNSKEYDIIHSQNYHTFPALAAALTKKTTIVFSPHYHGSGNTLITRILHYPYRLLGHFIFSRADLILCDTTAEVSLIKRHFPKTRNIYVLPPGIAIEKINHTKKQKLSEKYILSVGRLEKYKNTNVIIQALQFLQKDLNLIIVGRGVLKEELKKITEDLCLTSRVSFLEGVTDKQVYKLLKNACCFITMSRKEAYGLSLLEAAAAETSIVASNIPAHVELINKFKINNVFLVSPDSTPRELSKSIVRAMTKPSQTLGSLPSWGSVAEQTLHLYKGLCMN